jgi:hypothetical protein
MGLLRFDDALAVIRRLVEVADTRGEIVGQPIVLLGGTALAAWQIRDLSHDVDLYMSTIPTESIEHVETELRAVYGPAFRLDVTSGENVWGAILVRDIAESPVVGTIDGRIEIRALSPADLFLLKLASGRTRDLADLDLIASRTDAVALVARWNQLVRWHGDRHAILGFADALLVHLKRLFGSEPRDIIQRLAVTDSQKQLLHESHTLKEHDDDSR